MTDPVNTPLVNEVSICNQALSWLGQEPIRSFNDQSARAEWMSNNYYLIRDAVTEACLWSFATQRRKSETADRDEWDIQYLHAKPTNWITVLRAFKDITCVPYIPADDWSVEGDYVLAKEAVIYLYGVVRVEDTGKFSPMFIQALAARIAADAAIPLTENRLLQRDMWALYEQKLLHAEVFDGRQGKMERARAQHLERRR